MNYRARGGLAHKTVDFEWLQKQALDDASNSLLQTMQKIRQAFIALGQYPKTDKEVVLRLRHATLATTLNCSYSTLYAYQEIFLHKEHRREKQSKKAGGVIVDIGANEGLYAIAVCKTNPDAFVYCMEPNPITLARLEKNLELNDLTDRCRVIPAAVWSQTGQQQLEYLPYVTTNASLQGVKTKSRWLLTPRVQTVTVPTVTLDRAAELYDFAQVAVLKIDTEGSEVEVLRGASRTLATTEHVVVEYHSDTLREEVIEIMENDRLFRLTYETRDKVHATQSCGNLYFEKEK